jgi:DNA-binding response OmpR family regulator
MARLAHAAKIFASEERNTLLPRLPFATETTVCSGKEAFMQPDKTERILQLLDQLVASHTAAALCVEEMRSLACDDDTSCSASTERPIVDQASLAVRWKGKTCRLGSTVTFRLFERLSRRPNYYVDYEQLLVDVWEGNVRTSETIRSVVTHLKRRLRESGMGELAEAIKGQGRRYSLLLDPAA